MGTFCRGEVHINYEVRGNPDGFPILLIALGGMRSAFGLWPRAPWNPLERLEADYKIIAMDQRNAGSSRAPVSADDGWEVYTADQLALLDHLGVESFMVLGMCIGGPYLFGLMKAAPERVVACVMFQPIGLDNNRADFYAMFDAWASELAPDHPEADEAAWSSFREHMFGGDFLFNTTPDEVRACQTPILLFMGDDLYHPQSISREIAELAPAVTFVEAWKDASLIAETDRKIRDFLGVHASRSAGS